MMYMCDKSDVREAYKKGEKRGYNKGIKEALKEMISTLREQNPVHVYCVLDFTGKETRILEAFSSRGSAENMICNLLRKHGGKSGHYGVVERTLRPV